MGNWKQYNSRPLGDKIFYYSTSIYTYKNLFELL